MVSGLKSGTSGAFSNDLAMAIQRTSTSGVRDGSDRRWSRSAVLTGLVQEAWTRASQPRMASGTRLSSTGPGATPIGML